MAIATHSASRGTVAPAARGVHRPAGRTGGGASTTYCYRTSLGVRGTTTDPAAIPVGAEVERTVTA